MTSADKGQENQSVFAHDTLTEEVLSLLPEVKDIISGCNIVEKIRSALVDLSFHWERDLEYRELHPLERAAAQSALPAFRRCLSRRNESRTGQCFLSALRSIVEGAPAARELLEEVRHLFLAMRGTPSLFTAEDSAHEQGGCAGNRNDILEDTAFQSINKIYHQYPSGLDDNVIQIRKSNVRRILDYYGATMADWRNYSWHLEHIIKDTAALGAIVSLTEEEEKSITYALEKGIPFGITPYYASLLDREHHRRYDHALRAQVIPTLHHIREFKCNNREEMDFMGEQETSPVELVTRRYPMIAIFKPYRACAQICMYCQRNWEIDQACSPRALASQQAIDDALAWFRVHREIRAVLITGGDPLVLGDEILEELLHRFSAIPHIERIRIGTRTPVVLPQRLTDRLAGILKKAHQPGRQELSIITHTEHPYEVTPEMMKAVQRVKRTTSINFYNQQVFTVENSRRFESVALRRVLKLAGIDPYYVFHAKGKKETGHFIVPLARLLQEWKEEAHLTPGLVHTDEPVFNMPAIGKNRLSATDDHELIMIAADGRRIYEMRHWERTRKASQTYLYQDVPVYTYLMRLAERGENPEDYQSIWYYY